MTEFRRIYERACLRESDSIEDKKSYIKTNFAGTIIDQLLDAISDKDVVIENSRMVSGEKGINKLIGVRNGNVIQAWDFIDLKNEALLIWLKGDEELESSNSTEYKLDKLIELCTIDPKEYYKQSISKMKKKIPLLKANMSKLDRGQYRTSSYYTYASRLEFFEKQIARSQKKLDDIIASSVSSVEPGESIKPIKEEPSEYFLLGYWGNPYRGDNEYYWMRGFDSRKEALAAGKRKQERGQPKTFTNWVAGTNKVFSSQEAFLKAAKAVGLNPRLDEAKIRKSIRENNEKSITDLVKLVLEMEQDEGDYGNIIKLVAEDNGFTEKELRKAYYEYNSGGQTYVEHNIIRESYDD